MRKFTEELLQFIWQHKLLKPLPLFTRSGSEIKVLHPGELNRHSGPDFSNARIRIHDLVLSGNVEVHITTSDWLRHNHQHDRSYDQLILHVVYEHDRDLEQNLAHHVEVLELKNYIDDATFAMYEQIAQADYRLPCHSQLPFADDLRFTAWLERMAVERLEDKTKRIELLFEQFGHDHTQTFYTLLLRHFGFQVNTDPFELLARQLPVTLLLKHSDNLLQLEALLLGCSSLIDKLPESSYAQRLKSEFDHLSIKYGLSPLQPELFKFSRTRPGNFPTVRLRQFAMLMHAQPKLFHHPHDLSDPGMLKKALSAKTDHDAPQGVPAMGIASIESLLINAFAPFLFFYSRRQLQVGYSDTALLLLDACGFESNVKTKLFLAKKQLLNNAANSQGLIHLHDRYCAKKQCLKCGIAASLLKPGKEKLPQ